MEKSEPLPLFLVTHRGALAVNDNEIIATRAITDREAGPLAETLIEVPLHRVEHLTQMVNILAVAPAPAGDFRADDGTVVHVADDGSWHNPAHHGG